MTDAAMIVQLMMEHRADTEKGQNPMDEKDYVLGRVIHAVDREIENGAWQTRTIAELSKLYDSIKQSIGETMAKGGFRMWYGTRFGCGSLVYPIIDVHGGYIIGNAFVIRKVILEQVNTNVPNAVYYDSEFKYGYKEADLFGSQLEAGGEVKKRTIALNNLERLIQ